MKKIVLYALLFIAIFATSNQLHAQTVFWFEDFDDGGGGRWTLENAPGSGTNPTPAGIVGLIYEVNNPVFDNFVINDQNTPELSGSISVGTVINNEGAFVRGRHYACSSPSDLPNPFINTGAGPNQSLHITANPACATLLYGGTPQSDDWNCISDPDNGDVQTKSEQIAYLNTNIDATGKCNIKLTADFFLGGDADGIKSHSTILYSIDGGITWKIVKDSLHSCTPFLAGSCNNWHRRTFAIPSDADNQPDLRIAFRWYDDGDINNTGDYALGASFNVDNVMLSACDKPNVDFSADQTSVCKNQTVTLGSIMTSSTGFYTDCFSVLTDNCSVTAYSWNIPGATYVDGTSSSDANPHIQFGANGNYTIELTASNCAGDSVVTKTNLITVTDCPPAANFFADILTACIEPTAKLDTVSLTDLSTTPTTAITAWNWTITPVTVTYVNGTSSTDQNPQVTFNATGTYQISLQVTTSEGTDTETKTAYVEAISCECAAGGGGGPVNVFSEDFDGNGGAGSNWAMLNEDIGAQGDIPNQWWISDAEDGNAAGSCGSAGSGDASLHVSSCPCWAGDLGAAYEVGAGLCGVIAGVCPIADKRSYSVAINTTGVTGMTLTFNYIEGGEGTTDDALLIYSTNNGTSWSTLSNPAKTALTCAPQGIWTAYSIPLPASCENITGLRIGFRWYNNDGSGSDPSFAVDDISIDGTGGGGGGPSTTWDGTVSTNWNTAANWSSASVPTSSDDVLIPSSVDLVGTFMPTISTTAVAKNVCNFGTVTLTGNNTLTIDEDLLNEGVITTDNTNAGADIIFANSPSTYRGNGTMYDVDVAVTSSNFTLENDITPRSFSISTSGTVDLATFTLSINKNLTKTAGTFTTTNGEIHFIDACGSCVDATSNADVSLNANQSFGNVLVNKTAGVKTSLLSAVNHTFTSPKTLTIQSGILDANTNTLNGTGNLTMTGGEIQLAKCATAVPELTGTYSLTGGQVTLDGTCNQVIKGTSPTIYYYDVEFTGTGIKSLNSANLNINNQMFLNLPGTTGNYVDAGTDTVKIYNSSTTVITRTGGHVVGNLSRAFISNAGTYEFYVGSDNSDAETYYEPIYVTPQNLSGATELIANFSDANPNPGVVSPVITFGFSPTIDTIADVEDEGYWHVSTNTSITGGTYEAMVSPDIRFWTFSKVWGGGQYTLLKQPAITFPWDYTSGGSRIDDSTTTNFSDFSNFALGFSNNNPLPLPVELLGYNGICTNGATLLSWVTATEINAEKFILEKSLNGINYTYLADISAAGNSNKINHYYFEDANNDLNGAYYRLKQQDFDGSVDALAVTYVKCEKNSSGFEMEMFPNPSTGVLNINVFTEHKGVVTITIYDLSGSIVMQDAVDLTNKGINLYSFDLNKLSNGTYIINAQHEEEFQNKRLIIMH